MLSFCLDLFLFGRSIFWQKKVLGGMPSEPLYVQKYIPSFTGLANKFVQNRHSLKALLNCFPKSSVSCKISNTDLLIVCFYLFRSTQNFVFLRILKYISSMKQNSIALMRRIQEDTLKIQYYKKKKKTAVKNKFPLKIIGSF